MEKTATTDALTTPQGPRRLADRLPSLWLLLQVLLVAAAFLFQMRVVLPLLRKQPEATYRSWSVVVAALSHPAVAFVVLVGLLVAALGFRRLRWSVVDAQGLLRLPLTTAVVVLAWSYSTYDVNFFVGQTHTFDRLLVLGLGLGAGLYPGLAPLFFSVVALVIGQFSLPIGYSWTDLGLLVSVMMMANAWLLLRLFVAAVDSRSLVYLWMCTVGAAYFAPAAKKWALSPHGTEWALHNDIANIFVSAHLNGWLPDMPPERVLVWAARIHDVAVPLQVLTLILELLPMVMVFSRRLAVLVLLGLAAMHAGIYLASGILFWKWMAFDVAFALVLWRKGANVWSSYRWVLAALALPIMVFGVRLGVGTNLGWFDTRFSQFHTFWALTADGGRYRLDELDFSPFDKTVAQDRLFGLHAEKQTTVTLGATFKYRRFQQLQQVQNLEQLQKITRSGASKANRPFAKRFDRFVRLAMQAHNRGLGRNYLLAKLGGPMHIDHHAPTSLRVPPNARVLKVQVVFNEVLYTGSELLPVRELIVREIDIPRAPLKVR